MDIPFSKEEIKQAIKSVMKENKLRAAYIRPNLYYGYGNLGLIPKACPVELSIGCWTWGAYLGEEGVEKGVHALLVPNLRVHISQMDTRAKVGGVYTQSTISGKYARDMGCDEAIFMNLEGRIAEGPGENILIVKGNLVKTNDENESVLPGITRSTILELAKDLGYDIDISPITLEEFLGADEACFAGTAAEVTPITRVTDGRNKKINKSEWPSYNIGQGKPGPIIRKLAKQYADLVRGENSQYDNWLTYVYDSNEEVEANLGKV
jgi:branched-chain amino acid aminotransferase